MIRGLEHPLRGKGETWNCSAWRKDGWKGIFYQHLQISKGQESSECCQTLFNNIQWQNKGQWKQARTQKVTYGQKKKVFYCESYITLEQAAQRGYGISLSGDTKKPHGCFFILSTALSYIDLGTGSSPQNAALTHKHEWQIWCWYLFARKQKMTGWIFNHRRVKEKYFLVKIIGSTD